MPATLARFDFKEWVNRFGAALEDTAARAHHMRVPFGLYGQVATDVYQREMHRRYEELGALSRTDPYASKLFDESDLGLDTLPDGVQDILLEHPVIARVCSGGSREDFHLVQVLDGGHANVESLIANLAKLSVKVGGSYAATMLHRFLVASDNIRLHAHEITVLHGLELRAPITVGRGAYLASYDAVRERFGLPENPEWWLERRYDGLNVHPIQLAHTSSRSVLVRRLRWGPAVAPCDRPTGEDSPLTLRYPFPADHRVESITDVFEEREVLMHLLGIAVRSKLVSHTVIMAVPSWMGRLDPNLRTSTTGHSGVFDVWPEDHAPSRQEIDAFAAAARGWVSFCAGRGDRRMELAVRRTAACFGIAGGKFGFEDRLIDAGIALEAMYGPIGGGGITRKISQRATWLLGESTGEGQAISKQMKSFYKIRSKVVHGTVSKDPQKRKRELADALASGRELARRTLFALLRRGPINHDEWRELVPEELAYASDQCPHSSSK